MYNRIYVVKRPTKVLLKYYLQSTALEHIQVISGHRSYSFCQHAAIELTLGSIKQCYFPSNSS